jgi:hypothetical protein
MIHMYNLFTEWGNIMYILYIVTEITLIAILKVSYQKVVHLAGLCEHFLEQNRITIDAISAYIV